MMPFAYYFTVEIDIHLALTANLAYILTQTRRHSKSTTLSGIPLPPVAIYKIIIDGSNNMVGAGMAL